MILKKVYDEKGKIQKVWYDSTMIFYTEMREDHNNNYGDLYVVFKNNTAYRYDKVSFQDYLLLLGGGTDASQGKTLNKIIKGKYDYSKVPDFKSVEELQKELNETNMTEKNYDKVFFVFGEENLTPAEFEVNYVPYLYYVIHEIPDSTFIVGDHKGTDILTQNFLLDVAKISDDRLTVCHCGKMPNEINPFVTNIKDGFETQEQADEYMRKHSKNIVAFVRDVDNPTDRVCKNILHTHILKTF